MKPQLVSLLLFFTTTFFYGQFTPKQQRETDSLLVVLKTVKDTSKVKILHKISRAYKRQPKEGIDYAEKSLELSKRLDFKKGIVISLNILMDFYRFNGNLQKGVEYAKQYVSVNEELENQVNVIKGLSKIGILYAMQGHYAEASNYFYKSLKEAEKTENKRMIISGLTNIARIHLKEKKYEKALEYYEKSLVLIEELKDNRPLSVHLINMGELYSIKGDNEKALATYIRCLELYRKSGNKDSEGSVLNNIGGIYMDQKDYKKALQYYQESLKILKEINRPNFTALQNIAGIYYNKKEYKKAIKYYEEALKQSSKMRVIPTTSNIYRALSKSYSKLNQHQKALDYYKEYVVLKDSIISVEKSKQIGKLEAQYQTQKKEQEIIILEKDKLLLAREKRELLFFLVVALLILGLLGFLYKQRKAIYTKQQQLVALQLDSKNRELTTTAMHLAKNNETFNEIKERLQGLEAGREVKEVLKTIQESNRLDKDWASFSQHFNEVHPNFYKEIKKDFPELTSTELKHLAYLKMDLSNKEIGLLCNVTSDGVKQRHYRIGKKMKLLQGTTLRDFIKTR